ncbi:MAG: hypothetical protein J2P34_11985 [Actinobacteria bacterium]|nr:hypothetical protein [Actinomycetota bacterium]
MGVITSDILSAGLRSMPAAGEQTRSGRYGFTGQGFPGMTTGMHVVGRRYARVAAMSWAPAGGLPPERG